MSHIKQAHDYWKKLLKPGDRAIDATSGNGHDSLVLARLILPEGELFCLDAQEAALTATKARLNAHLSEAQFDKISFMKQCHSSLPGASQTVKLIVYNLGYLPGGNKALTTMTETTLKSLEGGLERLTSGGALSITCYPGHLEGAREEAAIQNWVKSLDSKKYFTIYQQARTSSKAPSLILVNKT